MIYFDSSALLKFVKQEKESAALRSWRQTLPAGVEMVTSQLSTLEISRTLLRAGADKQRVPYVAGQAIRGLYLVDVTSTVLNRARAYGIRRLGSLDAIHLATADPFLTELTDFVTYDDELAAAAAELGLPAAAPA
ncbi:MAG TPA: type II toxin-antitoxin system VapC family toxin [Mycobacteriales bacterium]|nr:type II toxin-antitoxin system VapC family toxin [Mycobacteriales bacterium]